jgi:hypothetical protein
VEQLTSRYNRIVENRIIRPISLVFITLIGAIIFYTMLRGIIIVPQFIDLGIIKIYLYSLALLSAVLVCIFLADKLKQQDTKLSRIDVWEAQSLVLGFIT